MQGELTEHQFADHTKALERHENWLKDHDKMLENTVTISHFYKIVGILMTVVVGMFYLIYNQLQDVVKTTSDTQSKVSFIQGTLQNADIKK